MFLDLFFTTKLLIPSLILHIVYELFLSTSKPFSIQVFIFQTFLPLLHVTSRILFTTYCPLLLQDTLTLIPVLSPPNSLSYIPVPLFIQVFISYTTLDFQDLSYYPLPPPLEDSITSTPVLVFSHQNQLHRNTKPFIHCTYRSMKFTLLIQKKTVLLPVIVFFI